MSRIGRLPVAIPAGVQVVVNGTEVTVKGPKGELNALSLPVLRLLWRMGKCT